MKHLRAFVAALAFGSALGACTSTVDDPECPLDFHAESRRCVENATTEARIVLSPGAACVVPAPSELRVRLGQSFQFENKDATVHTLRGTGDGQVWLEVAPGALSAFTSIAKAGRWEYEVSACGARGVVVVE